MKPAELQTLMSDVAAHVEIVLGDRDTGIYYEPEISSARLVTMWKLVQANPGGGPHYITYFESRLAGESEQFNSSFATLSYHDVLCMRL